MVASSNSSARSGKRPTGKTSKVKVDDVVTVVDVAEFFRSAAAYAQQAGIALTAEEREGMLVLGIPGLGLRDGQIVARDGGKDG
jgi:hypothetical protein